ncbi:MAG: hypothetical protein AVDCRST_MAG64-3107 [uncultured Phycisphaerae bacterium]|uniref:Uncharacterized protein n=1 Tax=uncultured Phycisphaerae bacterium TaxID=904963 RepID=A0A6J4PV55_9BACT|nr:MAG: hypothetical protein AVDCRST_MAG64-3107 [uncultured Phycisphaerae bacterium]
MIRISVAGSISDAADGAVEVVGAADAMCSSYLFVRRNRDNHRGTEARRGSRRAGAKRPARPLAVSRNRRCPQGDYRCTTKLKSLFPAVRWKEDDGRSTEPP